MGRDYNMYDEQNEIRMADMEQRFREQHSGDDGLDIFPDSTRDRMNFENPMGDGGLKRKPKKKKTKRKLQDAARKLGRGEVLDEAVDLGSESVPGNGEANIGSEEDTRGGKKELTSTDRFGALRKLIRQRSSLTSTFLEHATDANILKVYNKVSVPD